MILNGIQNGCHLSQQKGEGARGAHETITAITSQTHCHLLIRGPNAQTHQTSHKYTSTHTKPTRLPHLHHGGVLWHQRTYQPSITPRNIHNRQAHYEEFIFRENTLAATSRVTNLITKASDQIHSLYALPIICTIPPSSLDTWNHTHLNQHKTAMLKFYPQYPEMQHNLIDTIIGINTNIISINQSRHVFTPKLADTIITKPGKNKKHRIHYSRLVDRVHPTESVKGDWARILMQAIMKNRSGSITRPLRTAALAQPPSPDSDSNSDHDNTKRNWKYLPNRPHKHRP